jgi:hypothetical protein
MENEQSAVGEGTLRAIAWAQVTFRVGRAPHLMWSVRHISWSERPWHTSTGGITHSVICGVVDYRLSLTSALSSWVIHPNIVPVMLHDKSLRIVASPWQAFAAR